MHEGTKAENIWHQPPLMKNLTPIFYNTVLTLCPQLNTAHHLLSRMLSRTLINKRKFLRRQNRIQPMPSVRLSDNGHGDDDDNSSKYVGNTYCISHCSCRRSNRCTLKQVQRTSTTRTGHYNQRWRSCDLLAGGVILWHMEGMEKKGEREDSGVFWWG